MNWIEKAAEIYSRVESGAFITDELSKIAGSSGNLSRIRAALFQAAQNCYYIEHVLKKLISFDKTDHSLLPLLKVSAACLMFNRDIPQYAICNEAVNSVSARQKKFVNAVLRNITRHTISKKEVEKYFFPPWFAEKVNRKLQMNPENQQFSLYVQIFDMNCDEFINSAQKTGAVVRKILCSNMIAFDSWPNFTDTELFKAGKFYVQNPASVWAYEAITDVPALDTVLDLCAAPGGKTVILSRFFKKVIAVDKSIKRVSLLNENLSRLKLNNVQVEDYSKLKGQFDAVCLDAPCSASGTILAHPEWKLNHRTDDFSEQIQTQRELLKKSAEYVKKNGYLIYSTCSLFTEENQENIIWFLEQNREFSLYPFEIPVLGEKTDGMYQFTPWKNPETEGFFICRLKKGQK